MILTRDHFLTSLLAAILCLFISSFAYSSGHNDAPMIGAQVFIEPGQSEADIDQFFSILKENGMTVARIRMFGSHIMRSDGVCDYSLYDTAFDKAEKYGIKLFVTLFPPTSELEDVGGFKFPKSKRHLEEIEKYIRLVVTRYKDRPALHTWVLQNEPGKPDLKTAGSDWLSEMRVRYNQKYERKNNEYLKADFLDENFVVFCHTEYLSWISEVVKSCDPKHGRHINPHQLMDNLQLYDFSKYEEFLTSLGVSMHQSWHFGYFERPQYALGVSIMADIIRDAAGSNPFWITELQGGNVTTSGSQTLCPTAKETAQWLWTGVASGAKGVIFWTLNQRKAVNEAGEWGLIDYQRNPSDRLLAAKSVASEINKYSSFFKDAHPLNSSITILYNRESLMVQSKISRREKTAGLEGKSSSAVMKSVCAAYEAVSSWGVVPQLCDMSRFDWDSSNTKCIILPNMVSLPSYYWDKLKEYVASGGKAIVTGFTGFYDEFMRCNHMDGFPLKDCFGAQVKEYKADDQYFELHLDGLGAPLPVHMWRCSMLADTAEPICVDGEDVTGVINRYGNGTVVWLPVMVDLGAWRREPAGLASFYGKYCSEEISEAGMRFSHPAHGVLVRMMERERDYMMVVINKNADTVDVELNGKCPKQRDLVFGNASLSGNKLSISPEECAVFIYKK